MNTNPELEARFAKRAFALTRAGALAPDRAFLDIVEPDWDDATPFEEVLRRTRLVLERTPSEVEVFFERDGRVKLKQHPSGVVTWSKVAGDDATMCRRIDRGLRRLAVKIAAKAERERAEAAEHSG